jgi:hypothetical protein
MKAMAKVLLGSLVCSLAAGMVTRAEAAAFQDAPPPRNPSSSENAGPAQGTGRGSDRRPSLFGKLTAVHDQSIEITRSGGDTVTVKISGSTQYQTEGEAAELSDLKVGDIIFVRGEENADHTWTAQMIGTRPNGGFGGGPGGHGGRQGGRGGGWPAGVLGQDYVFGEVKAMDAPKLTILRPDNVTQTVELNEETSLRKGRDSITMADIQAGDHILVRGAMANNAFQPKSVVVIGPEQWKRMQEMGMSGGPPANPPKDNSQPQKPPELPH